MKRLFKSVDGLRAFLDTQKGNAVHVMVLHDDGCSPSRCACKPWFEVQDLTADVWIDAESRQAAWIKGTAS
jgi:hypothetical protein